MPRFRQTDDGRPADARSGSDEAIEARDQAMLEIPPSAASEVGAISSHAPRPIGVDPAETGAFETLSAGSGAVMGRTSVTDGFEGRATGISEAVSAQRLRSSQRPSVASRQRPVRVSKAPVIIIGVIAAIVLTLVVILVINLVSGLGASGPEIQDADRVEQTQVAPGETIQYDGYTYSVAQSAEGPWDLVRASSTNSDPLVLFSFPGTPTGLILCDGAFIIPENLAGSWDVVAWTMGDGSVPALLANEDGSSVGGEGQIAEATLDGTTLNVTLADGQSLSLALS